MTSGSRWAEEARPGAADYDARWARLAASGADVHGEVDFVMAWDPRRVLDAGCGTGRVAIELSRRGVQTVGVDLDPAFLEAARGKAPALDWRQDDLETVQAGRDFDIVIAAGNVMIFLVPGTEEAVMANLAGHLTRRGRFVAGFQLRAGHLSLDAFDEAAERVGLSLITRYSSWDRAPYAGEDYAVSVLTPTGRANIADPEGAVSPPDSLCG